MTSPTPPIDHRCAAGTWSLIHAERAALAATLTAVADYYQDSDLPVLTKSRVRGLQLTATDGPFTAGAGPRVSGTTLTRIMAMSGRAPYCDEFDGDGVTILRERQATPRP